MLTENGYHFAYDSPRTDNIYLYVHVRKLYTSQIRVYHSDSVVNSMGYAIPECKKSCTLSDWD